MEEAGTDCSGSSSQGHYAHFFSSALCHIFTLCRAHWDAWKRRGKQRWSRLFCCFFFFPKANKCHVTFLSGKGREAFSSHWPPIIWIPLTTHHKSPVKPIHLFIFFHHRILFCSFPIGNLSKDTVAKFWKLSQMIWKWFPHLVEDNSYDQTR